MLYRVWFFYEKYVIFQKSKNKVKTTKWDQPLITQYFSQTPNCSDQHEKYSYTPKRWTNEPLQLQRWTTAVVIILYILTFVFW